MNFCDLRKSPPLLIQLVCFLCFLKLITTSFTDRIFVSGVISTSDGRAHLQILNLEHSIEVLSSHQHNLPYSQINRTDCRESSGFSDH